MLELLGGDGVIMWRWSGCVCLCVSRWLCDVIAGCVQGVVIGYVVLSVQVMAVQLYNDVVFAIKDLIVVDKTSRKSQARLQRFVLYIDHVYINALVEMARKDEKRKSKQRHLMKAEIGEKKRKI